MLSVAAMNGIEDTNTVYPAWMRGSSKAGISRAAAQSIMLAVNLKVIKGGALGTIPIGMDEVQRLAR